MTESELRQRKKFALEACQKAKECFHFLCEERDKISKEIPDHRLISDYYIACHFLKNIPDRLMAFALATNLEGHDMPSFLSVRQDVQESIFVLKSSDLLMMGRK